MRYCAIALALLVLSVDLYSQTADEGWKQLKANEFDAARSTLLRTAAKDPRSAAAWFGLSMEAGMRNAYDDEWSYLVKALESVDTLAPYMYSFLGQPAFSHAIMKHTPEALRLLTRSIETPDPSGILWATACSRMGAWDLSQEKFDDAKKWYDQLGAITTWRFVGPLANISNSGHYIQFSAELEDNPSATFKSAEGGELQWLTPKIHRPDRWIDMNYFSSLFEGQFINVTYVYSPLRQRVQFRLGAQGSFKLIINEELVRECAEEIVSEVDAYITECTINEGWNKVIVKIGASKNSNCNFILRVTSPDGKPIKGLKTTAERQSISKISANPKIIEHPYPRFFADLISRDPTNTLNYLLLANIFIHNGQMDSTLSVIRMLQSYAPDCILGLMKSIHANNNSGRKEVEESLSQHVSSIAPDHLFSLQMRLTDAIERDQLEEAAKLLNACKKIDSTSYTYLAHVTALATKNADLVQLTDVMQGAFERYPEITVLALWAADLATVQEGSPHTRAIEIIEESIRANASLEAFLGLAKVYGQSGRTDKVIESYERALMLMPHGCGLLGQLTEYLLGRNEMRQALETIERAIEIAPAIPRFWASRGLILQNLNLKDSALVSFRRAIALDPNDQDSREKIRLLEEKPHPFTLMPQPNIDSIIRVAPTSRDVPKEPLVFLYEGQNEVVYDGSRQEYQYEMLLRVMTVEGIDQTNSYSIPSGSVIEKAVVRKPNGREIPGDQGDGEIVFTGLEVGDFVHVKLRAFLSEAGMMGRHYISRMAMSYGARAKHVRFAVLTPSEMHFEKIVRGAVKESKPVNNEYGTLYVWETFDESRIIYEDEMPSMTDCQKAVEISSMPGWEDIVLWYNGIIRSKLRPSYELTSLVDSLLPRSESYTRDQIIETVYKYITRNIRYSYVPFRQSGYVPQDVHKVIRTRVGDCKDVATLCIAMLAERGITAHPVLVNTETTQFERRPLPSIVFDHVIVKIPNDSKPLYLDLTADGVPIGSVPYQDREAFALVINDTSTEPIYLSRTEFTPSTLSVETSIVLDKQNIASIQQTTVETGLTTQSYRTSWRDASMENIRKSILEMLGTHFADATLDSFDFTDPESLEPTFAYTASFSVPSFLSEAGQFLIARLPWERPFIPRSSLSYAKRTFPIDFSTVYDSTYESITITVPDGFEVSEDDMTATLTTPQFTYIRTSSTKNGVLTIVRTTSRNKRFVPVEEYAAFKTEYNRAVKEDRRSVLFMPVGTVVKVPRKRR